MLEYYKTLIQRGKKKKPHHWLGPQSVMLLHCNILFFNQPHTARGTKPISRKYFNMMETAVQSDTGVPSLLLSNGIWAFCFYSPPDVPSVCRDKTTQHVAAAAAINHLKHCMTHLSHCTTLFSALKQESVVKHRRLPHQLTSAQEGLDPQKKAALLNSVIVNPSAGKNSHMGQTKVPAFSSGQTHASKVVHATE